MLPLDDDRWSLLTHAYGVATDIPPLLARLRTDPASADITFRDIDLGALNHQNSVSTALYAAIPYLVDAAQKLPPEKRADLLGWVGCSMADATLPGEKIVPVFLREALDTAVAKGMRLLLETLSVSFDEETTKWLLAALAGFKGHSDLCHVISSLDCLLFCPECGTQIEPMKSTLNLGYSRRQPES